MRSNRGRIHTPIIMRLGTGSGNSLLPKPSPKKPKSKQSGDTRDSVSQSPYAPGVMVAGVEVLRRNYQRKKPIGGNFIKTVPVPWEGAGYYRLVIASMVDDMKETVIAIGYDDVERT